MSPGRVPAVMRRRGDESVLVRDIVVGALAGAVGGWVAGRVRGPDRHGPQHGPQHGPPARGSGPGAGHRAGRRAGRRAGGGSDRSGAPGGMAPGGMAAGALYGALRGRVPGLGGGRGGLFGLGLGLALDAGRGRSWLHGMAAGLAQGLVTDALCRGAASLGWGSRGVAPWSPARPVRYHPGVEHIAPDEAALFERIVAAMRMGGRITRERHGRAVRTSHAKAHGLLRGELRVLEGLPAELRQGLFAAPRRYPAVVRLSHVPGELLDDRSVSGPRGMALKVLEVEGEMLPGHAGGRTQDWVLDSGSASFIAPGARSFLAEIAATEAAAALPEGVKGAVSAASLAANRALNAVGLHSAVLDFYGHPALHPLGETYFSQCPLRFGEYIAKLAVFPDPAAMRGLEGRRLELREADGLRAAVAEHVRTRPARFLVAVQLCTDLERMPVENAMVEWPQAESPYRVVAELVLPPQEAWSAARQAAIDEDMAFSPAHSLAAHRPLGSINRARIHAYEVLARERREANGRAAAEPRDAGALPG